MYNKTAHVQYIKCCTEGKKNLSYVPEHSQGFKLRHSQSLHSNRLNRKIRHQFNNMDK
jgi:hypothetical protein